MIRTASSLLVTIADQIRPSMEPITTQRGSSSVRASSSNTFSSAHSCCALMKVIPCLARLESDLLGSNSNLTYPQYQKRYRNRTLCLHCQLDFLGNCYEGRQRLDVLSYRFTEAFLGAALMAVLRVRGAGFVAELPSPDGSVAMSCHRASVDRFVHLRG